MRAFSVVLPAHNSAAFIEEALESVRAQTLQDFELIVVDDGSTDGTWQIIESWKGHFGDRLAATLNPENRGPANARNTAIRKGKGEFVAFLDSDDVWPPEHLAHARDAFEQHGDRIGLFAGPGQILGSNRASHEYLWPTSEPQPASSQLLQGCYFPLPSVCIRRTLLLQAGGFAEDLNCYEDWWLYLQLSKITLFVHSPVVECLIRRRDGSVTTSGTQMSKPMYRDWVKAYLRADQSGLWNSSELRAMLEHFVTHRVKELADYLCGGLWGRARWMAAALLETGLRGRKVWFPILTRGAGQFLIRGLRKGGRRLGITRTPLAPFILI